MIKPIHEYVNTLISAKRYDIMNEKKIFGGLFDKKNKLKKEEKENLENKYETDSEYKKLVDNDIRIIRSLISKILKDLNIQKYVSIISSIEVKYLEDTNGKYYICSPIYNIDGYKYCNDNNLNVRKDWEDFEPVFEKWADDISSILRNYEKLSKFKYIDLEIGNDWDSWNYSIYFKQ